MTQEERRARQRLYDLRRRESPKRKASRAAARARKPRSDYNPEVWRAWYERNREHKLACSLERRKHVPAEHRRRVAKQWRDRNPGVCSDYVARRRARGDTKRVAHGMYVIAKRLSACLGFPHEVDHIIPVKGRTVSGLHVIANLRVVPKVLNRRKSNHLAHRS